RGFGLLPADARLEASEDLQPLGAALVEVVPARRHELLHRDGDQDLRPRAEIDAVESGLRDADDGHRIVIEADGLADELRVAAEAALPVVVGQDGDGIAARNARVVGAEEAPGGGGDTEHVEIISRDELALDSLGLAGDAHAEGRREAADHSAEDLILVA